MGGKGIGVAIIIGLLGWWGMAAPITLRLEMVLARDTGVLDGRYPITFTLESPEGQWQETHDTIIYDGRVLVTLGTKTPLDSGLLYDQGVALYGRIDNDVVTIPLTSVPFSLFAHAADLVNTIYMAGVFHTDIATKRVGIAIDDPTPTVRLEVGGALRVGDSPDEAPIGSIRWHDNRLEGRHNDGWKYLDVGPGDGYESKWTNNNDATTPAFYVTDTSLRIATDTRLATVTIGGDVYGTGVFQSKKSIRIQGDMMLSDTTGISASGVLQAQSIALNATNYWNHTDGLVISGIFTGKGHGVTHIQGSALQLKGIDGREIADGAIHSDHIADSAITGDHLAAGAFGAAYLADEFQLESGHIMNGSIVDRHIKRNSIEPRHLATDFELTPYVFEDAAVVSINIAAQNIDATKIADRAIETRHMAKPLITTRRPIAPQAIGAHHIAPGTIQVADFQAGALSLDHLMGTIPIARGGTNQTTYGMEGGLLVVSANQLVEDTANRVVNGRLGLHEPDPQYVLDVTIDDQNGPLYVKSVGENVSGMAIANDLGRWHIDTHPNEPATIRDALKQAVVMTVATTNDAVGIGGAPGSQSLQVHGGVRLGDALPPVDDALTPVSAGGVYFSVDDNEFKFVGPNGAQGLTSGFHHESYMHTPIAVQAVDTRVLMGERAQLRGSNHSIGMIMDATVSGDHTIMDGIIQSTIQADHWQGSGILDAQLEWSRGTASWIQSTQAQVRDSHMNHIRDSRVRGSQLSANWVADSRIEGTGIALRGVRSSQIAGAGHWIDAGTSLRVSGQAHRLTQLAESTVEGQNHAVAWGANTAIFGEGHAVTQTDNTHIDGKGHGVIQAKGARITGQRHRIIHGDGTYNGERISHIGTGSPQATGRDQWLIGRHNHRVTASHHMAVGSSMDGGMWGDNSLVVYAPGGVTIRHQGHVMAQLSPNGGSWSVVSDAHQKNQVVPVDHHDTLQRVMALPVYEWSYQGQSVRHIGPMAQDFFASFGLGSSDTVIQTVDADGVILSALKGLNAWYNQLRDTDVVGKLNDLRAIELRQQTWFAKRLAADHDQRLEEVAKRLATWAEDETP